MDSKLCCMCKDELPCRSFSKDRTKEDGLAVRCKSCDALMYQIRKQKRKDRIDFVTSKICSRCKTEKDASSFGVYTVAVDKLRSECKDCRKVVKIDGVETEPGPITFGESSHAENGVYVWREDP